MRISDWSSDVCSSDLLGNEMTVDLKYPRTYHLPSSPGLQNDARRLPRLYGYKGRVIVATEKMDGEGRTLKREKTYPRSPEIGRTHGSTPVPHAHLECRLRLEKQKTQV